ETEAAGRLVGLGRNARIAVAHAISEAGHEVGYDVVFPGPQIPAQVPAEKREGVVRRWIGLGFRRGEQARHLEADPGGETHPQAAAEAGRILDAGAGIEIDHSRPT